MSSNLIIVVHADDVIIFSPKKLRIDLFIKSLIVGPENFDLTDEGNIDNHVRVEISNYRHITCELK